MLRGPDATLPPTPAAFRRCHWPLTSRGSRSHNFSDKRLCPERALRPTPRGRMNQTIGRRLSDAREAIRASLYQASRDTKIRVDFLESMERDDFSFVSGGLYVRGMLRSYVRWLGLNEAAVMQEYDRLYDSQPEPSLASMIAKPADVGPKTRRPNWVVAGVAAAMILLVLSLIGVMGPVRDVASPPPTETEARATDSPTTPPPAIAQAPADGVRLTVQVISDKSWVAAYLDGNDSESAYQGTLVSGDARTFDAKDRVKLIVGNLGAVRLTVNGRDLGIPGLPGKVGTFNFTPESTSPSQG
jgi:cytoskeleton protein RodZ